MSVWAEENFSDPKFRVYNTGVPRPKLGDDGQFVPNTCQIDEPFLSIKGLSPFQPDFFLGHMIEWQYLPYDLTELACPVFGTTSDLDLHIHNNQSWLPAFDEVITVGSEEWAKASSLRQGPSCTYPKLFGINPNEITTPGTLERDVDLFVSGSVTNTYHPDKAQLTQALLSDDSMYIRCIEGFLNRTSYSIELARSKTAFTYVRHPGSMPSRGIESLAAGCAVLTQPESALRLFFGENEGVYSYQPDTLVENVRRLVNDWESTAPKALRGSKRVLREFTTERCISQFLRYLTVKTAILGEIRPRQKVRSPHQKRVIGKRGWGYHTYVNYRMLSHTVEEAVRKEKLNPSPHNAINMAREVDLFLAHDASSLDKERSEVTSEALKEAAANMFHQGLTAHPNSLILKFNQIRHFLHHGAPEQITDTLDAIEILLNTPKTELRLDPSEDVMPWDYYDQFFNYRSYLDLTTEYLGGGNTDKGKLVDLIRASLAHYLGLYTGKIEWLEQAAQRDSHFPHYSHSLAKALFSRNTEGDLARASEMSRLLFLKSILITPSFELLAKIHSINPKLVSDWNNIENRYRKYRRTSFQSGPCPELDTNYLVLPPETGTLPYANKLKESTALVPEKSEYLCHPAIPEPHKENLNKILMISFECAQWNDARAWSYNGFYAFRDAIEAHDIERITIPAVSGVPSWHQCSFLSRIKKLTEAFTFDQVWIWITHNEYDPAFLSYLEKIAPVRVGVIMESLEHTKDEELQFPNLKDRRAKVLEDLKYCTHALTFDEEDAVSLPKDLPIKAMWCPPVVSWRDICKSVDLPEPKAAEFLGTPYNEERRAILNHPSLKEILRHSQPPEKDSTLPLEFDNFQASNLKYLLDKKCDRVGYVIDFFQQIHRVRRHLNDIWQKGLRQSYTQVNLPSIFKSYAGRVVESMAAGRPVISWKPPGARSQALFAPGKEILWFDRDQPEQLADQIHWLQANPQEAKRIAENARQKILKYHTAEIRVQQVLNWIESGIEANYGETQPISNNEPQPNQIMNEQTASLPKELDDILKEANTCYEQGNSDGAINALEQALELTGRHPVILRALGAQLFSSERYTWARAIFEEFRTACPEDATGHVQYAITAFHDGDTDACVAALEQALALEPNNTDALKLTADIDIREERWESARAKYDKIAATGGITAEALHALAFCQFKTGDVERSIDTYEQLLGFNADDELAEHNLGMLRNNLQELSTETEEVTPPKDESKNEVNDPDDALEQADFYMQAGNQQAALKELERSVLKKPKDAHLVEAFGSLLFSQGKLEQARVQFRRLIELTPSDAMAYTRLAMTCYELERTEEFESALGLAMEIDPEQPEMLHFLGKVNIDEGRHYDAGRVFGKLLEIEPDNVQNLLALGNCLYNGKEEATAAEAFERALQLDPENSVARESLAVIRGETSTTDTNPSEAPSSVSLSEILAQVEQALTEEDHAKAVQLLEHALRDNPEEPDLLNALGNLHFGQNQNDQAAKYFGQRASLLPDEVDAQLQAAMAYLLMDDSGKFEDCMEKALALDPANPQGLKLLASANFKAEQYEEAAKIYVQALSHLPEDVEMILAMGVCFQRLQDSETAEACFRRALEIDPYNQIASENLQTLTKPQHAGEEPEDVVTDIQTPVTTVGSLTEAHDLLKDEKYLKAWTQTVQAIEQRPFHPEAYLMLTEIALNAGDEEKAKACLDELVKLTPNWSIARKTLDSLEQQQTLNSTDINWPPLPGINQNRVSVCMIVKDEEQFIDQCLESVKPIASQIIVVDTGSTDRTVEIAKEHGAEVHHHKWSNDFAAARNIALAHVRGDWVLIIDADEALPQSGHEALKKDLTNVNVIGYRIPLLSVAKNGQGTEEPTGDGLCHVPRLFRNAPGIHFIGCVHEQAFSAVQALQAEWGMDSGLGQATLTHYGYDPEIKKERNKVKRNLDLMEMALKERPQEPSLLMNYALDLFNDGQIEAALDRDREAFQVLSGVPCQDVLPEVRERLISIFCFHLLQAEMFEELLEVSTSPLAIDCGPTASIHYSQALALLKLGRHEEAIAPLQSCISKRNEPVLTAPFKGVEKAGPHHLLADCLAKTDQHEEAKREYDLALKTDPTNTSIRYGYAQFLTSIQEPEKALHLLHEAIKNSSIDCSLWSLGSQIVNAHIKDGEVALHWTACTVEECSTHPEALKQRGVALLTVGRFEEALPFFAKAPQHPGTEAAKILCQISTDEPISPIDPEKEVIISTAFVHWYRRLLDYESESAARKIVGKIDSLNKILPTAAGVLEEALAEYNE
jgi:tetratricopeptide (TPR) repeat protein